MTNPSDGGLIPAAPRHSGRYAQRPADQRPWGVAEDLVLWPVLAACGSEFAYREACVFLCKALDREPVYPASAAPDTKTRQNDAVALIERRTVTAVLAGDRPAVARLALKLPAVRSGHPLTWAECEKLIPQYVRRCTEKKPSVSEPGLYALLGRTIDGDCDAVGRRMLRCAASGCAPGDTPPDRRPLPLGNVLEYVVRDFAGREPGDVENLSAYWDGLCKLKPEGV